MLGTRSVPVNNSCFKCKEFRVCQLSSLIFETPSINHFCLIHQGNSVPNIYSAISNYDRTKCRGPTLIPLKEEESYMITKSTDILDFSFLSAPRFWIAIMQNWWFYYCKNAIPLDLCVDQSSWTSFGHLPSISSPVYSFLLDSITSSQEAKHAIHCID